MEAVLRRLHPPSTAPASPPPRRLPFQALPRRELVLQKATKKGSLACCCLFSDGLSSRRRQQRETKPLLSLAGRRGGGSGSGSSVVAAAAKKKKKSSKPDADGLVPLPDEDEFFFPEAVLLKKKTVQEDGRVLPEFADAEEEKLFEFLNIQLESEVRTERMRHYEVVYLIHEDFLHEVDNVVSKVQDFIREKKGRIWRLNNWGLRRLAYKIKKAKNANYILMNFELEAKLINDFKSMLDKDERIIRHLVIKRDEAITEDCPPPPEFHTLRAGGMDEDSEEEYDDGEVESEMDNYNGDDFGENIIVIDDEDEGVDDLVVPLKDAKISKAKRRVKATS